MDVLFEGIAIKCEAPKKRQDFNGAHFCSVSLDTHPIIDNTMIIGVGIGFRFQNQLYIVDHGSHMYLEDDCLAFGTFENNYAEMRVSGNGWHQIEGMPVQNDNESGWVKFGRSLKRKLKN